MMRLRRSDVRGPGLRRRGAGRGFRYVDHTGASVRDADALRRVRGLVIPPAWRDVWICPHPNGHIQAVGTDDAGRRQYLYHEQWRQRRDVAKHRRVVELARRLPALREAVADDLGAAGLNAPRVLAGALRILDRGVLRVGGEEYATDNGTRGVATLLRGHVRVRGGVVHFDFPAKGGTPARVRIRDGHLAALVSALRRGRDDEDRLLVYRESGVLHEVRAEDVNDRLRALAGEDFTAKDLRTWHATVLAAVVLAELPAPTSERARRRSVAAAMREVAAQLGNTPAVARRSYVDYRVIAAWERGDTIGAIQSTVDDDASRNAVDEAVIALLDGFG